MYKGIVFLDFETADNDKSSICQVGMKVIDSENNTTFVFNQLIKPYSTFNDVIFKYTYIHKIKWNDVKNMPYFIEVWKNIERYFNKSYLIIAHNAGFDKSCLEAVLKKNNVRGVEFDYACTYNSIKKLKPGLKEYNLEWLCSINNINFNHHDAFSDVEAMEKLFLLYFGNLTKFVKVLGDINYSIKKFEL